MTEQPAAPALLTPAPPAIPVAPPEAGPAHPFFAKVAGALHHGGEDVQHAAQVIEGNAASVRAYYLDHAATAHELAALTLRLLKDASPEDAAALEQVVAKALPVAETAARIAWAVLKVV